MARDRSTSLEGLLHSARKHRSMTVIVVISVVAVLGLTLGLGLGLGLQDNDDASGRVSARDTLIPNITDILSRVPLIDGHNDLADKFRNLTDNKVWGKNLKTGWEDVQTDIPRLRKGMVGAQFWAIYVSCKSQYKDAVTLSLDQTDVIKKFVSMYPDDFEFVTASEGIMDAFNKGKIGSMMGLEGGHSIDSSLGNLRMFYELGVRYMTLTHTCNTPWAGNSHMDDPENKPEGSDGLTEFGKIVVKEMNRLGMMVDLSHVSHKTMLDALSVTQAPVMFSHSSVYSLCNHSRNVRDDVLDKLKENNGIIMINFYPNFVSCSDNSTIKDVVEHINYVKRRIGTKYIGIGGDFDGVDIVTQGLEDVSKYPDLFEALVKSNETWSPEDIENLAGKNLIRVFKEVEKVKQDLINQPPSEDLIPEETWRKNDCRTEF
ncbi:dipeptidase 1-like [Physella acuta]|uniref:dipeptidase 1-like n=1 Tax=Physella acuta TaxID=109671 RepID=UPI0027DB35D4|nr:dipeptidase 1-like [Physella acuta]